MSGDVIDDDRELIEEAIDHDRGVSGDVTDDTNHADDCENPDLSMPCRCEMSQSEYRCLTCGGAILENTTSTTCCAR